MREINHNFWGAFPMSKRTKIKVVGPWKSIQAGIWLMGLAVLAWKDWWWPGILVLLAISALTQAAIQKFAPGSMEEASEEQEQPDARHAPQPSAPAPVPTQTVKSQPSHPTHRLPSECPKCSGPIRGVEVRWTGELSADCPYCGANLPLAKES
jgi:hypothetical protein